MQPLRKLVLKPTVFCYHKCAYCDLRQDFYKEMLDTARHTAHQNKPGVMPLNFALKQVADAYGLGMRECLLSGGDPLMYPHLIDLIKGIQNYGDVFVFMNSVGTGLTAAHGVEILDAGLRAWNFSVDTLDQDTYDRVRGVKGAFRQTMDALDVLRGIRRDHPRYSDYFINFMTVITRHNYRQLPELFRFCVDNDVSSVFLMNVYGDHDVNAFLLDREQIREFRAEIIPAVLGVIDAAALDTLVKENAHEVLEGFFSADNSDENYARGVWWKDFDTVRRACKVPDSYALIEADGNVLPCCLVEIAHEGVVGNVRRNTLGEVWNGEQFASFRENRIRFCQRCPAPRNRTVGLVPALCRQFIG